jgi:hypothetical protein
MAIDASTDASSGATAASAAGGGALDVATSDAGSATLDAPVLAQADATPELLAADGAPLAQTDAFPSLDSASYRARLDLLWRAIVQDDAALARPAFFPLVAYAQVKAIPNPAADYEARLMKAFARDIHAYHQKLGDDAASARLLRLDVPVAKAKWMAPGSEGNKLGYERVLDSILVFVDGKGKERTLPVKSMISWRGEWYVVHLAGFK